MAWSLRPASLEFSSAAHRGSTDRPPRPSDGPRRHQAEIIVLVTNRTMRWRLLAHPYLTGAVVALAVNDHILKGHVHGALTGKLSDFAGVFVIAVVLAALTGRPRFACCVSGLGFAAIKTVPLATALAAPFLGGSTLRDPTDLVALVMLYPAYRFASRGLRSQAEHSIPKQVLTLSSAVVATLAMSATSCAKAPTVDAFTTVGGTVFARVYDETYDGAGEAVPAPRWASSQDGGATWVGATEVPASPAASAREACSADLGCFRLGDERVEHSPQSSGSFTTSFTFTGEQRQRIKARSEGDCGISCRRMVPGRRDRPPPRRRPRRRRDGDPGRPAPIASWRVDPCRGARSGASLAARPELAARPVTHTARRRSPQSHRLHCRVAATFQAERVCWPRSRFRRLPWAAVARWRLALLRPRLRGRRAHNRRVVSRCLFRVGPHRKNSGSPNGD